MNKFSPILLPTGGFLLGIGLMIVDELFQQLTASKTPALLEYEYPLLGRFNVWIAWEIDFLLIIGAVAILIFAK